MRRRYSDLLLVCALGMLSCERTSNYTGICEGAKDGDVYSVYVLNFTYESATFQVDGRPVGKIEAYDSNDHVPGFQDLGQFVQCVDQTLTVSTGDDFIMKAGGVWGEILITKDLFVSESSNGCYLDARIFTSDGYPPDDWNTYDRRLPNDYVTKTSEGTLCAEESPTPSL